MPTERRPGDLERLLVPLSLTWRQAMQRMDECGRGILLMRSFADDVQFNDTGNEVTMLKYLLQASDDHVLASDDAEV